MDLLKSVVLLYTLSLAIVVRGLSLRSEVHIAKSGCQSVCGNLSIPYPFGIGEGCYKDQRFEILCLAKTSYFQPYLAFFGAEVIRLSLEEISMLWKGIYDTAQNVENLWNLTNTPFTYSERRNTIVVFGCDIVAYIVNKPIDRYTSHSNTINGCASLCMLESFQNNGCSAAIERGMKKFDIRTAELNYLHNASLPLRPSLVTVSDTNQLNVRLEESSSLNTSVSLDWVIGEQTCIEVKTKDPANFGCGENTECVNSTNGPGYHCSCLEGYMGNPYLPKGCRGNDKCETPNPCTKKAQCFNTPKSYYCECPEGHRGDGRKNGSGCVAVSSKAYLIALGVGIGISVIILLAIVFWSYTTIRKGNKEILKKKFFRRNGGMLLKQENSSGECNIKKARIFLQEELEKATDNFSRRRILGRGGFGTVYKGMLQDGRIVAIKKSREVDRNQTKQFINELVILSQINHNNVVRLFGYCLETDVPLLVYEFISNGTLSDHLHGHGYNPYLSWKNRLRILIEISGALAYLHSSTSIPIFHRDIKSSNILLDENFKAKVSDFGLSRTMSIEKSHLSTGIQGTFGYLDPEYFHSGQFTEKSDVYGFGVILVELLTGRKPVFLSESGHKSLSMHFISSMKDNCLFQVLDSVVANEASKEEVLAIGKLAKKCLKPVGKKRPSMKEVAIELEILRRFYEK